ncbi:MAG: S49 family peptidase [Spirochaetales bacterium]|nr:S49 family peptidase [Spirochaetales bacterium]
MIKIKILLFSFLILFILSTNLEAQSTIPSFHSHSPFILLPSEGNDSGLYGFLNPAALTHVLNPDFYALTYLNNQTLLTPDTWGLFFAVPHLSFGTFNTLTGDGVWYGRYRLSMGFGSKTFSFGTGYEWNSGSTEFTDPSNLMTAGFLFQPAAYLSIGLTETTNMAFTENETALTLGIRPLASDRITLFADYAFQTPGRWEDLWDKGHASVGALVQPWDGVYLSGKYFPRNAGFEVGFKISSGNFGVTSQVHYDGKIFPSIMIGSRAGSYEESAAQKTILKNSEYLFLDLKGMCQYRSGFFSNEPTLLSLLKTIDTAQNDPLIAGIAIDISGFYADREMLWEIRHKLAEFKQAGKHVIIYVDRAGLWMYYLASIADKVVMDPLGSFVFTGFLKGSTYLKEAMEKLGIGFEEWRLFTYKSAYEMISRDSMSEAEKEQWQAILESERLLVLNGIREARNIPDEKMEELINSVVLLDPEKALKSGLIDSIGRSEKLTDSVREIEGRDLPFRTPENLNSNLLSYETEWSEAPSIAVIYALGTVAMDFGMNARNLSQTIQKAADNPWIEALVIRVDSPGGDALASDYVAEAIRQCNLRKPVIISQGMMAASGGYWVSMYGNTIVTSPVTLTGSIGVAGGWFYDKGFKKTFGLSTDFIGIGDHADLGYGLVIPFINFSIPDRNLDVKEKAMFTESMQSLYGMFVNKVAKGRNKSPARIEKAAQGRIWTGEEAKKMYLTDEIGGLLDAINIARERADIPAGRRVSIIEMPELPFFSWDRNITDLLTSKVKSQKDSSSMITDYFSLLIQSKGYPMPLVNLDLFEYYYTGAERNFPAGNMLLQNTGY